MLLGAKCVLLQSPRWPLRTRGKAAVTGSFDRAAVVHVLLADRPTELASYRSRS